MEYIDSRYTTCLTLKVFILNPTQIALLTSTYMKIENFDLAKIVMEIRYESAYLLWDRCGTVWTEATSIWPGLKPMDINPNRQSFRLKDKYEFHIELDKSFMIAHYCKAKDICEDQERFIRLVSNSLNIEAYERIGTRFIYELECEDIKEGGKKIYETGLTKLPAGPFLNVDGNVTPRHISFLNENEDTGVKVDFQMVTKKFEIEKPLGVKEFDYPQLDKKVLLFDVDYYTKKIVLPGQLNVSEWVKQVDHSIKRDSQKLFGE